MKKFQGLDITKDRMFLEKEFGKINKCKFGKK